MFELAAKIRGIIRVLRVRVSYTMDKLKNEFSDDKLLKSLSCWKTGPLDTNVTENRSVLLLTWKLEMCKKAPEKQNFI